MLDPQTLSLLLEGQQEQSEIALWMSYAIQYGSEVFESLKSKCISQNATKPKYALIEGFEFVISSLS